MKLVELIEGDVIKGPWGEKSPKSTKPFRSNELKSSLRKSQQGQRIPLRHMFGGNEYNIILDAGFKFEEKPHYYDDIDTAIPRGEINRIEHLIGRKLVVYNWLDVLYVRTDKEAQNPLVDFDEKPEEETFILNFGKNIYFLCNRTGATKYIRMWARII